MINGAEFLVSNKLECNNCLIKKGSKIKKKLKYNKNNGDASRNQVCLPDLQRIVQWLIYRAHIGSTRLRERRKSRTLELYYPSMMLSFHEGLNELSV